MTTVVSYRLYCEDCEADSVIKQRNLDSSEWKVESLARNAGLCPECNPNGSLEDAEWSPEPRELDLRALDGIGAKAAQNLSEAGYDTDRAIVDASDDELLEVSWVGEKALLSLKEATMQLEPQQRWDE